MRQHTKIVRTRLHKFSTHGANSGTGSVPGQRSRCCYDTCCPKTSETNSRGHFCFCLIVGKLSCHTRPRTSVSFSEHLIFLSAVKRSVCCFTLRTMFSAVASYRDVATQWKIQAPRWNVRLTQKQTSLVWNEVSSTPWPCFYAVHFWRMFIFLWCNSALWACVCSLVLLQQSFLGGLTPCGWG